MVKYSIVMTSYNNQGTIAECLESLTSQLDDAFEVVIVDNESNDGTQEILKKYGEEGKIRFLSLRCSRGLGREVGIRLCRGEYVISQLDCDEIFRPILKQLISEYHKCHEGYLLTVNKTQKLLFFVSPRSLFLDIGGYNDLNYHEDRDLYWRAHKAGKLKYIAVEEHIVVSHKRKRRSINNLKKIFDSARDSFRINDLPPSMKKLSLITPIMLCFAPLAFIQSKLYTNFRNEKGIRRFNPRKEGKKWNKLR